MLRKGSSLESDEVNFTGEVKDGARVRVDWVKEIIVEAGGGMGKVKKMRAYLGDPATGWCSIQLLVCENNDCGLCADCKL